MDYFNVEFVMPGQPGHSDSARRPDSGLEGDLKKILQQAGDMLVQRKFSEAIDILNPAIKENPSEFLLHKMLMVVYLNAKRIPEAKRQKELLLREFDVKDPVLSIRIAAVALGKRYFDDAIFYFREAQKFGAEPGEWSILLGNALWRTGRLSEAEEVYQEVMSISDENRFDIFLGLSAIRMQQHRYHDAADLALHSLRTDKPKTRAIYYLGLAFMHLEDSERAITAFRDFVRQQPNYVAPYRWLERLTRKAGDDAEADAYNIKAREMLEDRRLKRIQKKRRHLDQDTAP